MLGEVIHGYRVDRALSADKGGFGDVYFATHVDSGAEAVVKVLKPEMSALRDIVARFFNEARAAASVHHPGIVQIHNVGYHGDRAYLLMERLRGDDLETRLTSGPLPVDRAVVFVRQTAGAIAAAHERGIVHRDLKPANLFVVADPDVVGGERVKVLDFGIAKLTVDSGAGKTQGVFGTPSYMSPEQCASSGAVDARADLYSLGCIFYELVCGRPPFGHGGIELIAAHLRDAPPPPRALAPGLPPAIEQVILRLLEKQPDHRYASAPALIAALDEAAAASGLPGASVPHLPLGGPGASASAPRLPPGGGPAASYPSPSTLGAAAGAAPTRAARKQRLGVWLGVGAIILVGGAVAAVVVGGGGRSGGRQLSGSPGDAGVAVTVVADATRPNSGAVVAAVVNPDATPTVLPAPELPQDPPTSPTRVVTESEARRAAELVKAGNAAMTTNPARYEEALSRYQEALAHDPQPGTFFNLAVVSVHLGHFDQATRAARAALAASPGEDLARKATKLLEKINQMKGVQGVVPGTPERASEAQRDRPEPPAKPVAERAAKLNEDGKDALLKGNAEEAQRLFERAYALGPSASLLINIGIAQYGNGRCQDARRTLQNLIATWPSDPVAKKAQKLLDEHRCE